MQPMLPSDHEWLKLGEKTEHIVLKASMLSSSAPAATLEDIRTLIRSMNSYYSNRIEGQGIHPANIEKALRNDFSASPEIAALQRTRHCSLVFRWNRCLCSCLICILRRAQRFKVDECELATHI